MLVDNLLLFFPGGFCLRGFYLGGFGPRGVYDLGGLVPGDFCLNCVLCYLSTCPLYLTLQYVP